MSIEITETIIKRFQVQLPAETMEALITKAALEAAGLKPCEGVSVKAHGFATKVEITQELDAVPLPMPAVSIETKAPEPASVKAAAPVASPKIAATKSVSPSTATTALSLAWSAKEDALIVSTAAEMGDVPRNQIANAVAAKLPRRTAGAIAFRMKNKLNSQIIAAKISPTAAPAPAEPTPPPIATTTATPNFAAITLDLAAHLKRLARPDGWHWADDFELMRRVAAAENTALIAAAMEQEPAFIVQRVDRLLGRVKGGAVTYGRATIAKALTDIGAASCRGAAA